MPASPTQRDYFAELYCAGIFGDAGWAVYFPKRDVGFDFIVTKQVGERCLVRAVQVKGLYPTAEKLDKSWYGFRGKLSAVHPEMVLVVCFFAATERGVAPEHIAYMPYCSVKKTSKGDYKALPAKFREGHAFPRRDYAKYFDTDGLRAVESEQWSAEPSADKDAEDDEEDEATESLG